jgi:hypothetical protein
MATEIFRPEFEPKTLDSVLDTGRLRFVPILTFIGYVGVFIGYVVIFMISLMTVGFLEIRQANMADFNAMIAVLEQRDGYKDRHLDAALAGVRAERDAYRSWIDSLVCFDIAGTTVVAESGRASEAVNAEATGANPKTCAEIKQTLERHVNELSLTEDDVRFRAVNLEFYYDQYRDGITRKAPQLIPALRLLDSNNSWVNLWARSPFELIEMFLLVCMGLLGGVISVMRCFVDPSLKTPAIAEFFYKPAVGAALSLGVYVIFRAAQIFLGVQTQTSETTVSTSIFLLAGLGLASGFCATQALETIESVAMRLLRSSGEVRLAQADNPEGSPPARGDGTSGPAAAGATPG